MRTFPQAFIGWPARSLQGISELRSRVDWKVQSGGAGQMGLAWHLQERRIRTGLQTWEFASILTGCAAAPILAGGWL
jgi:hypothetical protein